MAVTQGGQYLGLSTDTKPDVVAGSRFVETDTGSEYVYDGSSWRALGRAIVRQAKAVQTATIASGATESEEVDARGASGGGYALPSTFDGTTITFKVAKVSGGTFQALYDQFGNQVSATVAASRSYQLPAELFGWPVFKFVAGTSQSTTDTDIDVVLAG